MDKSKKNSALKVFTVATGVTAIAYGGAKIMSRQRKHFRNLVMQGKPKLFPNMTDEQSEAFDKVTDLEYIWKGAFKSQTEGYKRNLRLGTMYKDYEEMYPGLLEKIAKEERKFYDKVIKENDGVFNSKELQDATINKVGAEYVPSAEKDWKAKEKQLKAEHNLEGSLLRAPDDPDGLTGIDTTKLPKELRREARKFNRTIDERREEGYYVEKEREFEKAVADMHKYHEDMMAAVNDTATRTAGTIAGQALALTSAKEAGGTVGDLMLTGAGTMTAFGFKSVKTHLFDPAGEFAKGVASFDKRKINLDTGISAAATVYGMYETGKAFKSGVDGEYQDAAFGLGKLAVSKLAFLAIKQNALLAEYMYKKNIKISDWVKGLSNQYSFSRIAMARKNEELFSKIGTDVKVNKLFGTYVHSNQFENIITMIILNALQTDDNLREVFTLIEEEPKLKAFMDKILND